MGKICIRYDCFRWLILNNVAAAQDMAETCKNIVFLLVFANNEEIWAVNKCKDRFKD